MTYWRLDVWNSDGVLVARVESTTKWTFDMSARRFFSDGHEVYASPAATVLIVQVEH